MTVSEMRIMVEVLHGGRVLWQLRASGIGEVCDLKRNRGERR